MQQKDHRRMTAPASATAIVLDGVNRIMATRRFAVPPAALFRAHTETALIQRWMTGPEGWSMPACQCDPRTGGRFRFDWSDGKGISCHATGEYLLVTTERIVHVERLFLPKATPDNHVDTRFDTDGTGTCMTLTMSLPSSKARSDVLASGMPDGLEDSYARLDRLLATI
jgi:uncharacterized protein YndB with AHSA1/START domain